MTSDSRAQKASRQLRYNPWMSHGFTLTSCDEAMKMRRSRQQGPLWGLVAGAAVTCTTLWIRQGRMRRLALAGQIGAMTQQAIAQLGIPARSTTMTLNGLHLHAVVAGPENGPLVLLLHGFPENWTAWRHAFKPLVDAGYHVIAPDQRGYNLSDKPAGIHNYRLDALAADVRELIRASGRETAIIVGHDWGGSVAWQTAMDYPDVVDKLIIMNSPHPAAFVREIKENPAQQRRSWYMLFFQLPWLPELMLGQSPLETASLFFRHSAVNQNAYSSYDLHMLAASLSQPGALTGMLNYYRAAFRYRPTGVTRVIKTPTLIVWGENDVALGKSLTYDIQQWVTNVKIHYVSNCGHWVQNEAAAEVNAEMLAFLQPHP